MLTRDQIAARIAADIPAGSYVNLGIGQATLVGNHLRAEQLVVLHTENGLLNMGPQAVADQADPDLINAGKIPVTELPGASYFHHADSFGMIRGGHLDICVLGALQVSASGDLANWHAGGPDAIPAVGGAMDLAAGARQIYVIMSLFAKDGSPKLVTECSYPITGLSCVSRVYTEFAILHITRRGVLVADTFGTTIDELRTRLDVPLLAPGE